MLEQLFGYSNETQPDVSDVPCPSCGEILPEEAVEMETMIATCPACSKKSRLLIEKFQATKPANVAISKDANKLEFEITWLRFHDWVFLFTAVFMLPFFWIQFSTVPDAAFSESIYPKPLALAIPLLLALFAAGWFYYRSKKRATISLNSQLIEVTAQSVLAHQQYHFTIPTSEIEQIYYTRRYNYWKKHQRYNYDLHVVRRNSGEDELLIYGLEIEGQARFIEQEVEAFLKIKDRHVPGNYFSDSEPFFES